MGLPAEPFMLPIPSLVHSGATLDDPAVFKDVDDSWRRALVALRDGLEG